MKHRYFKLMPFLLISCIAINYPSVVCAERALVETLKDNLFTSKALPVIRIHYVLQSFSGGDNDSMLLRTHLEARGIIDLQTRRLKMELLEFRQGIAKTEDKFIDSTGEVIYDGYHWTHISSASSTNDIVSSIVRVSKEPPKFLLKDISHFYFPLFPSLLDVRVGMEEVALLELIGKFSEWDDAVRLTKDEDELKLTTEKNCRKYEIILDASRNLALRSHTTQFGTCSHSDRLIENRTIVSDYLEVGGNWIPSSAVMTQTVNGRQTVKRTYSLKSAAIETGQIDWTASIPPNALVFDERFGIEFITERASNENNEAEEKKQTNP